jgi:hypothetical protein
MGTWSKMAKALPPADRISQEEVASPATSLITAAVDAGIAAAAAIL